MGKSYLEFPFHETYPHPSIERKEDMYERICTCIGTILESHPQEDILVVSHEGSMKDIIPFLLHFSPQEKEDLWKTKFYNTALFCFEINNQTQDVNIVLYNDNSHLETSE